MRTLIQTQADNYIVVHKKRIRRQKILTALAAVVVFCTTYALILPAITWERSLICEIPEHHHNEACYITENGAVESYPVCGLEEHKHTAACFDAPAAVTNYYCGEVEHIHSKEQHCYSEDGSLVCTISEHRHKLVCKSNPNADVENAAKWEKTFSDVELTGNWADDVIAIAETQVGYTESTGNYKVMRDGKTVKGYTRYGDWYGIPYGDWCAMFCSFCLDYAGVKDFPTESDCERWIKALSFNEKNPENPVYYRKAGRYEPKPGDLIFFDWDSYRTAEKTEAYDEQSLSANRSPKYGRKADRAGFVKEVIFDQKTGEPVQIVTIEGDSANQVCENTYDWSDKRILGYGDLPENPESVTERTIKSHAAGDGAVAVVTGKLPNEAEVRINEVALTKRQMAAYFGKTKAAAMHGYVAYDITIWADGEEWQPDESVSVEIRQPDITVKSRETCAIAHVDGETNTVSDVTGDVSDTGNVTFEAESFSTYIIYTVEFSYGEYMYSINGNSAVLLSEIFANIGIDRDVSEVESVEFSNSSLITVKKTKTDWKLITEVPFLTEESLTVTFTDGEVRTIVVTDEYAPVGSGGYLVHPNSDDSWYNNDKLRKVKNSSSPDYAYFYHTETAVNKTYRQGGKDY